MVGTYVEALPPTTHLPAIKKIPQETLESLNAFIDYLRSIYNPEVRGSRRRPKSSQNDGSIKLASADTVSPRVTASLNRLRTDQFERTHAIRWLTNVVSVLNAWNDDECSQDTEKTIHNAASLLAICAGTSAAGTVVRDFTFPYYPASNHDFSGTSEAMPITVRLTDLALDNTDYGSVGAQTWGGACVLSEMLVEDPEAFGISANRLNAQDQRPFRVLELGAGTGLVSLTLARLLDKVRLGGSHRVEIVATDYYPSVLANLRLNVGTNIPSDTNSPLSVLTHALDWSKFGPEDIKVTPFDQRFDLILGADIVYEVDHTAWIHSCLTFLLRKPSSSTDSETDVNSALFHLVIPLRATHSFESSTVESVFVSPRDAGEPSLQILAKDTLICETETGEEVEYAYYKIGWI
jgi:hypothetical protein